ncbi:beta-lactamase/transpeptidase-like protein [Gonapodya prolifera JEL478]|uniref:Beta-lactamase/transpeptidase-like protein n=1 Tax=Gonapodya prolifera (strain JEL478) TaxID=1344416 RepID=A0A139AXM8_GONPJ|nr:beta-lactamase/transpeptidase-like protein [Gonapodya prolifera JEL478]|eukprot:KXS21205.1 beta-lactamase/transpeptidase-like protein [Gonapodya prolifera JEL478]
MANISGSITPGFEPVREAFEANFTEALELGASYVAYYKGRKVVDLTGGWADTKKTRPYDSNTIHVVHSSGKAIEAIVAAHAVSKGVLSYEQRIADIWPEFGQGGKADVLVKDLLEHSGGVGWLDREHCPLIDEMLDLDKLAARLAGQKHNFGGVLTKSYHAQTRGWYLNEVYRRTLGTTHGELVRGWSNQLGVDVFVGLPESADHRFCKVVYDPAALMAMASAPRPPPNHPTVLTMGKTGIKGVKPGKADGGLLSNNMQVLRAQTSSAFTVTNAAGLAAFANVMAMGGSARGLQIVDASTHAAAHVIDPRNIDANDAVLGFPWPSTIGGWGVSTPGTIIPNVRLDPSTNPKARYVPEEYKGSGWEWVGWDGMGGSQIQWDPKRKCAIGYAPNLLKEGGGSNDDRAARCTLAFVKCVEALESSSRL